LFFFLLSENRPFSSNPFILIAGAVKQMGEISKVMLVAEQELLPCTSTSRRTCRWIQNKTCMRTKIFVVTDQIFPMCGRN
jgi:hypothetical protein